MKKYARLFTYIRSQSSGIALYFVFSVLSIIFSLISLGGLPFFLKLIFFKEKIVLVKPKSVFDVLTYINYQLSLFIETHGKDGPVLALGLICVLILISVFLKNLFFYLSFYVLAPIKMIVVTKLRAELYQKLLQLPIGYFTDQRKGDVMSRMTNDIAEIETSVVGTLEGLIKDPINVLVILVALIFISPILSLFLFIFLPLTAFVIGRISRSLKKQSNISAIQLGELLSTLEETLTGLR
ncbi:MAG: ABC transporter ATP-binding protein, partial [Bacteroidota bacterium]|nr:ABC transporter ATP-binding protein [Bacteroidota bacterium]